MRAVTARRGPRRRRAWTALLVASLVAVPILEVWLLIQVGRGIGVLPTVGILVVEAVLGAWLMRREGNRAYAALSQAFRTGRMPTRELADAALVLVGGVLLMLPGFATDVVGFVCLLPFTRPLARRLLTSLVGQRIERLAAASPLDPQHLVGMAGRSQPFAHDADLIEGETVEDPSPSTRRHGPHVARIDPGPR